MAALPSDCGASDVGVRSSRGPVGGGLVDGGLVDRLVLLTHGLKVGGLSPSLTETVDAADALAHLDLLDRRAVRAALRATLVKEPDPHGTFDLLFDRYFPAALAPSAADSDVPGDGGAGGAGDAGRATDSAGDGGASFADELLRAVRAGDLVALRRLAAALVDAHGGVRNGTTSERYQLHRVMRAAEVPRLTSDVARELKGGLDHVDPLAAKLADREHERLLEEFRRMIAEEIRRRLAEIVGAADVIRSTRIDELEVMRASATELRAMRDAVRPLARTLAARMAQRRRLKRRGKLDVRRTVRRSLDSGGVPMQPALRDRKASKPDVVVLCDVSGSVAEFANFTLLLLSALHDELARLRSFVFVDGVAEVTELLETAAQGEVGAHAVDPRFLVSRPGVVVGDGHSDYGRVFERFLAAHGDALRPTTTLIVAGDARTNHRPPGESAFRDIASRVKQVVWLDPEPSSTWNEGDSRLAVYRAHCRAVHEVRTLRQLGDAVAELA